MLRSLAAAASLSLAAGLAAAQDAPEVEVAVTDLGGGLFMLATDRAGNVGLSVGEDGVVMIDAQTPGLAPLIREAALEAADGRTVDLLINTHWHYDHTGGNATFAADGATILAHKAVLPRLRDPQYSALLDRTTEPLSPEHMPGIEIGDGGFFLNWNGQRAIWRHAPDAHTDGDIWVHYPEADVIHAGDLLFSGMFPYIDIDAGGTVLGYVAALDAIAEIAGPDTQIIPGHGPLSTEADVRAQAAMLREARGAVEALVAEGADLEAVKAAEPLAALEDDWAWGFITTERMVETLYRDVTGALE